MVYNLYFSPTGGTKRVADILSCAMADDVVHVDLLKKNAVMPDFTAGDVCILSVPAFGGRVPQAAIEKIHAIRANSAKAVLVAAKYSTFKGFYKTEFRGGRMAVLPYNR